MNDKERKEKLEENVKFANMGVQLLNNEVFKAALTARKAQIFDEFCNSSQNDDSARAEAWRTMKNLDGLETYFRQVLESGAIAEEELNLLNH